MSDLIADAPDPVRVHPVFFKMMKDAGLNTDNVVEQKPLPMWADGGAPAETDNA